MKITLVPYAGLCNRLNAIISAIAYKSDNPEVDIDILWFKYFHCNCRFSDLFKPLPGTTKLEVKELYSILKNRPDTRFNLKLPGKFRKIWYDCTISPFDSADDFDNVVKGKRSIYIYKDNRFCKFSGLNYYAKYFQPQPELQQRIDAVVQDWENVVGIHIRRTDNARSIELSPMGHFHQIIQNEIKSDSNVKFYIATDDASVKTELINSYGDRIITFDLKLKRNSKDGMKDAVVDLFCLGLTKKIYGSAASTYSIFASKLFEVDLII